MFCTCLKHTSKINVDDAVVAIHDCSIYRKDRNANGGGVAVYVQSHVRVMLREDLMSDDVEVI